MTRKQAQFGDYDPGLIELAYDAKRFILQMRTIIEMAPLQVYYSGLLFTPGSSLIWVAYVKNIQCVGLIDTDTRRPYQFGQMGCVFTRWKACCLCILGQNSQIMGYINRKTMWSFGRSYPYYTFYLRVLAAIRLHFGIWHLVMLSCTDMYHLRISALLLPA